MLDLTVVILTYNEEIHLMRCLESVKQLADRIVIVDSFSNDQTVNIARSQGVEVYQHSFINHADQFQWGLDNCDLNSYWIMRMDADEYLEPVLQQELVQILPSVHDNIDGVYLKRKVFFYGKWIRYGGFYPHILLRIWRNGKGKIEQRWMDEHIVLNPGSKTIIANENMVDDNLKGITFWINKHNAYASREAVEMLNNKYPLFNKDTSILEFADPQARRKRLIKERVYSRMPLGFRALIYFIYRYFIRLGFLDGVKGFAWHFLQGFWYRLLVDIKIMELEERSGGDVEKLKILLKNDFGIIL